MRDLKRLIGDSRGVAAIEYALIALFIVAAGITTWGAIGSQRAPSEAIPRNA